MKYVVFLLEDNPIQLQEFSKIINYCLMGNDYDFEFIKTSEIDEQLLEPFSKSDYGIFFLDIDINGKEEAGIDFAEKVRQKMPFANIVFVTSHVELSLLTIERKIEPYDFIVKDDNIDQIRDNINTDIKHTFEKNMEQINQTKSMFNYSIGKHFYYLPMNEVISLETQPDVPNIVTLNGEDSQSSFPGSLKEIETEFSNLFRCNRNCLINLDKVVDYDGHKRIVNMENDLSYRVSVRKSKPLIMALNDINK